jgi:hypothetical protein
MRGAISTMAQLTTGASSLRDRAGTREPTIRIAAIPVTSATPPESAEGAASEASAADLRRDLGPWEGESDAEFAKLWKGVRQKTIAWFLISTGKVRSRTYGR